MRMNGKPLATMFLAFMLGSFPAVAGAQEAGTSERTIFIEPLQKGLADARARMDDEEFTGCFTTAFFVDDFAKRATSQATGQTMAEMLEKFVCSYSARVGEDRIEVTGWLTVNGETGPVTSEIIRLAPQAPQANDAEKLDASNWAVGRFLFVGQEIFRDPAYTPAN